MGGPCNKQKAGYSLDRNSGHWPSSHAKHHDFSEATSAFIVRWKEEREEHTVVNPLETDSLNPRTLGFESSCLLYLHVAMSKASVNISA